MPAIVSDSFNGAANTTINGRVASGQTWSVAGAVNGIQLNAANQLKATSSSGALARIEIGAADHYARVTALATSTTGGCGAAVRAVDNLNFIALRLVSLSEVRLFKRVGSTTDVTVAALTGLTLTLPVVLELRIAGQVATLYVNGAQVGAPPGYTVADAVFAGVTRAGIWGRGSSVDPLGDDFEGGTPGGAAASLAPARGVHALRGAASAVGVTYALAPTRGVHALRGAATAVGVTYRLVPTRGLHAHPGAATAVGVTYGLVPARGLHAHGGAAAALTPGLVPAVARHVLRGMAAVIAPAGALQAAGSRIPWRGGEALLSPGGMPRASVVATIVAERREVRVERP